MTQVLSTRLPEHLLARRAAQRREVGTQVIAAAIAVGCFVASGALLTPLNRVRTERQLVIDPNTIAGLPPDIALIGKLGTFRALAIDWAAIRAERLKEQGKDYEALQLHQTVCALAPRFPKIWVYAAWNMAYNISVSQYTPEARWQWVRNGIRLLRDKGIVYNPRSVSLYKELAWIYWHKIGDFLDDEHINYKRALAVEMERVLGPPPLAQSNDDYFAWFRQIVDAPRDVNRLIRDDAQVRELVAALRSVGLEPDDTLLEFVARRLRPELRPEQLIKEQQQSDTGLGAQLEVIGRSEHAAPLARLLAALRYKELTEVHRFDVDLMYKLMTEDYGPLDWRNAFSHSLYWSSKGDMQSKGYAATDPADSMNTARFILYSLQNLVTKGRITFYPDFERPFQSYIDFSPDTRYIPYLFKTFLRLGKEQFGTDPDFKEGTPGRKFMTGLVTNMHAWIQMLYFEGGETNLKRAENFYTYLRQNNPHPDGRTQERYLVSLDEFVMKEVVDAMNTWRSAGAIIRTFVQRALKHYSLGYGASGDRAMTLALKCYELWMGDYKQDINERRKLQTPTNILRDEIYLFMEEPQIDPLFKARLWGNLPLSQRQTTYDRLRLAFGKICQSQSPQWDQVKAFPEPPGMDEWRRLAPREKAEEPTPEQGERYKQ